MTTYCAAIVTFLRPEALRATLDSVVTQTSPPNFVVVADNDPGRSAERVIEGGRWAVPVIYIPMARNIGPAGGWAAAARCAQERQDRGEWLLVLDDDDPIHGVDVVRRLLGSPAGRDVGAVGLRGATMDRSTGRLRRADGDAEPVDYLASGGLPLYRWTALDAVGFFEESLFFGFEDLDLGLRLRAAGWLMISVASTAGHTVADTAAGRVPWREYYKSRALVAIARRHLGPWVTTMTVLRLGLGSGRFVLRRHGTRLVVARLAGLADGLRGHMGVRRYDPEGNPPKERWSK